MGKRYHNPFPGRPVRMDRSGLFLLSPEVDLKLQGTSMRGLFTHNGMESLFKRIERLHSTKREPTPALIRDLLALFQSYPRKDDIAAALSGDGEARKRVSQIGKWESFIDGLRSNSIEQSPYWVLYTIELEQASQTPTQLIMEGRLDEALTTLLADELLCPFFSAEASNIWSSKTKACELELLLASLVLEVRLSQLAAMDVSFMAKYPTEANGRPFFLQLMPTSGGQRCTPMRQLMNWLKNKIGAKSLEKILEVPQMAAIEELDISTLKRWNSGRRYPSRDLLHKVSNAIFGNPNDPLFGVLYTGVLYLNLIGYLAETIMDRAQEHKGTPIETLMAPWPLLPFGHDSLESWCQERYPVWLRFHQERLINQQRLETAEAVS